MIMIPIPLVSWGLTVFAVLLFLMQFGGKKGTGAHIARGIAVPLLVIAVIILNTISVTQVRGLTWDSAFSAHFWLGSACLVALFATSASGAFLHKKKNIRSFHTFHFTSAIMTATLLVATLLLALFIRLHR